MESDILQAIQEGRELQTRDGHAVRIYSTDGGGDYSIHGAYSINAVWFMESWTRRGLQHEGKQSCLDLIVRPRTIELDLWINVYSDGLFGVHQGREESDLRAALGRVACINLKRTITEGEGL